ncbi:MAG: endonuclease/exonuclease/phosphatase family protein [Marinibacterium sp.]|nr:endonuclease/exonuclease/phosphatase family protein [Marinibacterium sp.]
MDLTPPQTGHIRVATYNIRKCRGMDQRRAPERILSVLGALAADVVSLQEADTRLHPRQTTLSPDDLAAQGWQVGPFGDRDAIGWHGNALLWRSDRAELIDRLALDLPGLEPRGAIVAEFDHVTGPLRVIGAHLGLTRAAREKQAKALREVIDERTPMPTVLAGDLNDWRTGRDLIDRIGLDGQHAQASFPAPFPLAALDRIAHCANLSLTTGGVYDAGAARMASDHLPLWADFGPATLQHSG